MRIGIAVDYGKYAKATSLNLIAKKVFSELGELMNKEQTFTITALKYEDIGIGDVNQHFDCVNVPNMGGYHFPHDGALTSKNLSVGIVGIDEVVLGEKVYKSKNEWLINKPIIKREVSKWKKHVNKIKFIHVSTNSDKDQLIKYLNVPEEKIHVIPLGVDHEIFKPILDKEKTRKKILSRYLIKDLPYFIHVSETNWQRKNVLRMLEAFKKAKSSGIKQNLIIVGRTDTVVHDAARTISGVHVLGFVAEKELITLMQCADALILPSLHEGFGLPLVEAMSCGIPCITSNVFSPPEVVGDGGLFVDPYDTQDIANKIIEMATDQNLRETLSANALDRSKIYSWKNTAEKLLELLKQQTGETNSFDFSESFDLAAYRTLVTVCEILPDLFPMVQQDLLEFDYSRIKGWAVEAGLENTVVRDFLFPFREWLMSKSEVEGLYKKQA